MAFLPSAPMECFSSLLPPPLIWMIMRGVITPIYPRYVTFITGTLATWRAMTKSKNAPRTVVLKSFIQRYPPHLWKWFVKQFKIWLSSSMNLFVSRSFTHSIYLLSVTHSVVFTQCHSNSVTHTESLTHCHSLSFTHIMSLTRSQSLTVTHSVSITHCHSLSFTNSLSLTQCHSNSVTHSESLTHCHSLSFTHTMSLTRSQSLTVTHLVSLTHCHSLSFANSLSITQCLSLYVTHLVSLTRWHTSLSLTQCHSLSPSLRGNRFFTYNSRTL